jgi:endonuclease/exonuclease/phosphatase family metal-dependent hydrolase
MKNKKTGLGFIDKVILWINFLFIISLLLSYLSPYIDPRKGWLLAFFGLGYIFILGFNLAFVLYWLLRKKRHFLLSLVVIAFGYNSLVNSIGFRASGADAAKPTSGNSIRLLTFNAHAFSHYGPQKDTSAQHQILQMITKQQPDIIGFQEYFSKTKGHYDITDSLRQVLHTENFYFAPFTLNPRKFMGMAIFSKFPIVNKGIIALSDSSSVNQCLFIDVKYNNRVFRYYSVHLQSIGFDPLDYKYLDSVSRKGQTKLESTQRLSTKLINAFLKRSEQVAIIKNHAAACSYPYIIGGDFNDTPNSYAFAQMSKGLKNAFREKGSGFGRTYNGDFPNFQIDYILTSPQFDVASYKIIEKKVSDHYPVRSDVILN